MTGLEIGAALQAGKAAFDTLKGMAEAVNKSQSVAEAAGLVAAIATLGGQITEMNSAILQLSRENDELRRQLPDAQDAFKSRYMYDGVVCWKGDGDGRDGPFCPNCIDEGAERRLNPSSVKGLYHCVTHKVDFRTSEYQQKAPNPPRGNWRTTEWG